MLTREQQIDETIHLWAALSGHLDWFDKPLDEYEFWGVIQFKRRLFQPGDIVIGNFSNGQGERWQVSSVSSRGFFIQRYYVDFQRWRQHDLYRVSDKPSTCFNNRTQGKLLVCPDELQKLPVIDPAIRAWLVQEAACVAARP